MVRKFKVKIRKKMLNSVILDYYILKNLRMKLVSPQSSTLAWKIPWMEEPGRLQSMGSLRVRHD